MRGPLLSNIMVVGGNTLFPNYAARLYANFFLSLPFVANDEMMDDMYDSEKELRQLAMDDYTVRVHVPDEYGSTPPFYLLHSLLVNYSLQHTFHIGNVFLFQ
jgi:actin-related protein